MRTRETLTATAVLASVVVLSWLTASSRPTTTLAQNKLDPADPLPSWNDGPSKKALIEFVRKVTRESSPEFVPREERIATFDNDGTLWVEQPMYTQLAFALDRVKALAAKHPEWKEKQSFKAVLEGDWKGMAAAGQKGLVELVTSTHAGMTTEEFQSIVKDWLATARHPRFQRPYTECVYQPMLELLAYLRAYGFKTYIVTGGGVEFLRAWTEKIYGVPPEQVIGSSIKVRYELHERKPVLVRLPEVDFIDDKTGKPVGIHKFVGRRSIMAFGNSDGDFEMLQWVTVGKGPRLGLIVHHTDSEREFAYGRDAHFGQLDKALAAAAKNGWVVVDMKKEWKRVFPFGK